MVQIMNHKWINEMDEEDKASALITDTLPDSEFSEEVLTMMLARGIDREKTIQVLIFCLIIIRDYIEHKWGHGGLMVCALVSGWSAPDSSPGRRCCVLAIACVAGANVALTRIPPRYEGYSGQETSLSQCPSQPGVTLHGLPTHPGGEQILLVASCVRNQEKLRHDGSLGSYADFKQITLPNERKYDAGEYSAPT